MKVVLLQISCNSNTPLAWTKSPWLLHCWKSSTEISQKRLNPWVARGSLIPLKLQCTVNNVQNSASKITTTGLLISAYVSFGSCDLFTCQHPVTRRAVYVKLVQMVMYLPDFWLVPARNAFHVNVMLTPLQNLQCSCSALLTKKENQCVSWPRCFISLVTFSMSMAPETERKVASAGRILNIEYLKGPAPCLDTWRCVIYKEAGWWLFWSWELWRIVP